MEAVFREIESLKIKLKSRKCPNRLELLLKLWTALKALKREKDP